MEQIDRYYMSAYDPGDGMLSVSKEKYPTGDYVKYKDHERIVKEFEDQILAYQKESEETEAYIKSRGW